MVSSRPTKSTPSPICTRCASCRVQQVGAKNWVCTVCDKRFTYTPRVATPEDDCTLLKCPYGWFTYEGLPIGTKNRDYRIIRLFDFGLVDRKYIRENGSLVPTPYYKVNKKGEDYKAYVQKYTGPLKATLTESGSIRWSPI